jgi:MFS family permease
MSLAAKLVLLSSGIPVGLALSTLAPILPKMEAALSETDTDKMLVKMVIGITGAAVIIGAPIAGIMGDRMNRARIVTWAVIIFAAIGAAGYLIDNLWIMVGTRFLMGMAAAAVLTLGFAMAGDLEDEPARRRYTGWAVSIAGAVALVALILGGVIGDINWRLTFLLFLTPLPISLFAYQLLRNDRETSKRQVEKPVAVQTALFRLPIPLMLLALGGGIIQYIPLTYVPFYMRDLGIASSTMIGLAMIVQAGMVTIASGLFGALRARVSARSAFGMSFGLMGLGAAGVVLSDEMITVAASLCIIGVGAGWLTPNLVVSSAEAADVSTRARYVGLVKGTHMSGMFVGIIVVEPILRVAGVSGVLIAMAVAACAASLLFFGWKRDNGQKAAAPT